MKRSNSVELDRKVLMKFFGAIPQTESYIIGDSFIVRTFKVVKRWLIRS